MNRSLRASFLGGVLLLQGCGGSGVGNPTIAVTSGTMQTATTLILNSICATLVKCIAGLPDGQCKAGVEVVTGLDAPLGLQPGVYPNFSAIMVADGQGVIHPNSQAVARCESDLGNLSCSSPEVQQARDSSGGFGGVAAMMPPDCAEVF